MAIDELRKREETLRFDERPLLVLWEMTQACDLACRHCRASAVPTRDPRELDTPQAKRLLEAIARMGTRLVVLTGGDAAKRGDLVELVRYGASIGLSMAVTPSGTALTSDSIIEQLGEAGVARLAVSLDAPTAEAHDAFRGVEGSFAHSLRILEVARRLGIPTQINTSLIAANVDELSSMAALVSSLGAVLWSVFVVVPTGRASAAMVIDPERVEHALVELAGIAARSPFDVKTTAAPHYRRVLLEQRAGGAALGILKNIGPSGSVEGPRGINDGVGMMFVSHRGDIYPSGFLPLRAGNVLTDDIGDVYRTSELFRTLRTTEALTGKCGVCPFRRVCGGSRARAYAATGSIVESDPACAYMPRGYVDDRPARPDGEEGHTELVTLRRRAAGA